MLFGDAKKVTEEIVKALRIKGLPLPVLMLLLVSLYSIIFHASKHKRTLEAIFERPVRANIRWADIEKMFLHMGAEVSEGRGSRVRISFMGKDLVAHRPHPSPGTNKGAVAAVRLFWKAWE